MEIQQPVTEFWQVDLGGDSYVHVDVLTKDRILSKAEQGYSILYEVDIYGGGHHIFLKHIRDIIECSPQRRVNAKRVRDAIDEEIEKLEESKPSWL